MRKGKRGIRTPGAGEADCRNRMTAGDSDSSKNTCLPCGETLRNLTSVVVVLKVNSENKENQEDINKLYKKNIGLYSYVLLLLLFYCIN